MQRFYWLIDGALAGCSLPGGAHSTGADRHADAGVPDAEVRTDLAWLGRQGIGAVLSLTEQPLSLDAVQSQQMAYLHVPVPDLTAPTPDQFGAALGFIDLSRSRGLGVAVHCLMGQGRTGTVLAAYLIRSGVRVDDAIAHLRSICPGALSSPSQEIALAAYFDRRDWVL